MSLSKSRILSFRQCPKRLWLEIHHPELRDDSASQAAFVVGHTVGEVARRIYDPDGRGTTLDIGALGHAKALELSRDLLATSGDPIFEAGLAHDGVLAYADVMLPVGDGPDRRWRMIEVKSSTSLHDYQADDAAIQAHLANEAGVPLESVRVAHIDNAFIYPGGGDYRGLLMEEDLTDLVGARRPEVEGWIRDAKSTAALPEAPGIEVGPQCYDPFSCPFVAHCHQGIVEPDHPLTDLPRLHYRRREDLQARGITDMREVPDDELNDRQRRVKEVTLTGRPYFNRSGAREAVLAPGRWPVFIDFETVSFAVPIWPGTRPYEHIPFQFSVHAVETDGSLSHREFLDLSGDDPSYAFAIELLHATQPGGALFAYNAPYEQRILRQLADRFPDLASGLRHLADVLHDLLPIARDHYYHPDQRGSWSLKAVLPCLCPGLDYSQLDGVADGGMAMDAYHDAISAETTPERKEEIRRQLLAYCQLDTLALVRMWQEFSKSEEDLLDLPPGTFPSFDPSLLRGRVEEIEIIEPRQENGESRE